MRKYSLTLWISLALIFVISTTLIELNITVSYSSFHLTNIFHLSKLYKDLVKEEAIGGDGSIYSNREVFKPASNFHNRDNDFMFVGKVRNEEERKIAFNQKFPFVLNQRKNVSLKIPLDEDTFKNLTDAEMKLRDNFDSMQKKMLDQIQNKNAGKVGIVVAKSVGSRLKHFSTKFNVSKSLPQPQVHTNTSSFQEKELEHTISPKTEKKIPGILNQTQWNSFLDSHNYPYIINPREICGNQSRITLLLLVVSQPLNSPQRDYIRATWGSRTLPHYTNSTVTIFLLGRDPSNMSNLIQSDVYIESETHGDILQEDFVDSYLNLPIKTVMGLKWASRFCPKAKFVIKIDDDMMLNVERLLAYLRKSPWKNLYAGKVAEKFPVLRDVYTKFYVPYDIYTEEFYPPYCVGFAYVMSIDVVYRLYFQSLKTVVFPWEDVYIGILIKHYALIPKNIANFFGSVAFEKNDTLKMTRSNIAKLRTLFTIHELKLEQKNEVWAVWKGKLLK